MAQSPNFNRKGQIRNRLEAETWARSMDLAINEDGWKATMKKKRAEVDVRRLLALEMSSGGTQWEVAAKLEENRQGINIDESSIVNKAMRQYKLEKQLTALPQRPDRPGPAGAGGQ